MGAVTHDTLTFAASVDAGLAEVWRAFADVDQRTTWSVPAGEAQVYDASSFRIGGRDLYRCGLPDALEFHGVLDYIQIVPHALIVHTDTVTMNGQLLATALLTWEFEAQGTATLVRLTDQVTSFTGSGMVDGHRNGHTKALEQLQRFMSMSSNT